MTATISAPVTVEVSGNSPIIVTFGSNCPLSEVGNRAESLDGVTGIGAITQEGRTLTITPAKAGVTPHELASLPKRVRTRLQSSQSLMANELMARAL